MGTRVKGASLFVFSILVLAAVSITPVNPPEAFASWDPRDGWWYTSGMSGTGVSIEIQGSKIFIALYVFNQQGQPIWYTAGGSMASANQFTGDLIQWTGWPLGSPYVAPVSQQAGQVNLNFTSETQATLTWSLYAGGNGTMNLTKFMNEQFGGSEDLRDINGWWFDPRFNGMGWFLEVRGNTLFVAWYHYGLDGVPEWVTMGGPFTNLSDVFTGPFLLWANGQTLGGAYKAPTSSPFYGGDSTLTLESFSKATLVWAGATFNLERLWYGGGVPIAYTGKTNKATITPENALPLTSAAFRGTNAYLSFGDILKDEMVAQNATLIGDCGGQMTYTSSVDAFGNLVGYFYATNFCNSLVTVNGNGSIAGVLNLITQLAEMVALYPDEGMTVKRTNQPLSLKGALGFQEISPTSYRSITGTEQGLLVRDDNVGRVFRYLGLDIEWTDVTTGVITAALSVPTLYYPDYGWFAVNTTTNLDYQSLNPWFSRGTLILTGGNGTAGGPTAARVSVLPGYTFKVEVDTNGDSYVDWDSGTLDYKDFNF